MREKDENYIKFIKEMLVMNYYRMPDRERRLKKDERKG